MQSDRQVKTSGHWPVSVSETMKPLIRGRYIQIVDSRLSQCLTYFNLKLYIQFTVVVCISLFLLIASEADFQKEKRNNRIGFQIKSWKRQFETGLKANEMIRAEKNFCLTNAVKLKSEKYFSLRCSTEAEKYIFFGFTNRKLGMKTLQQCCHNNKYIFLN